MNSRSVNFYLVVVFSVTVILNFTGIISVAWSEIFSYAAMLIGMNIFYNSLLKNQTIGIFIGAFLFQIGILLFVTSKYELTEPRRIFIPVLMSIIGFSLLLTNLFDHSNKFRLFLSLIISAVGILFIFLRGSINFDAYINYLLEIINSIWLVLIFLLAVLFFTVCEFNREKKNHN